MNRLLRPFLTWPSRGYSGVRLGNAQGLLFEAFDPPWWRLGAWLWWWRNCVLSKRLARGRACMNGEWVRTFEVPRPRVRRFRGRRIP